MAPRTKVEEPEEKKDRRGVGPTSGVMATGAVGRAARAAAHTGNQTPSTQATLLERALEGRPILSGRGIEPE